MTLDQMIADVRAKLHALQTGRHAVEVQIEGQRTVFNRVSVPQLEAYLAKLLAQQAGEAIRGAIGIVF